MAVLEIKKYPDEVLRLKATPVKVINKDILKLIGDMTETMYAAPGVGLAAPQVGVSLRVIVIDISMKEKDSGLITLINPEVLSSEGEVEEEEGCLSVPDYRAQIKRAEMITVRGLDRNSRVVEIEGRDLLARALQHEIDHLNGTLIIDRISPIKRELFKKKIKKALKVKAS